MTFKSLAFAQSAAFDGQAILADRYCNVVVHYCSGTDCSLGFVATDFSDMSLYNVYVHENRIGVVSGFRSLVRIIGQNYINDNQRFGVAATHNSTVLFMAWEDNPSKYVTQIKTTVQLLKYAAIKAQYGSTVDVMDSYIEDDDIPVAHVQILNATAYRSSQYFGVALDSLSLITGTENLSFADPAINDGQDTVPKGQQIVGCNQGNTVALP